MKHFYRITPIVGGHSLITYGADRVVEGVFPSRARAIAWTRAESNANGAWILIDNLDEMTEEQVSEKVAAEFERHIQ